MPVYPEEIAQLIRSPKFVRSCDQSNADAVEAKLDCGCFVRVEMMISKGGRIEGVAFRTNGCGFMVAAAESLAASIDRQLLTELSGVPELSLQEPSDRKACLAAATNAFRNALAAYRQKQIDEFSGEKALICTCFGIAEETVEGFIAAVSPTSVAEVSNALRAGSGCGSCRMMIQEIIDSNDRQRML